MELKEILNLMMFKHTSIPRSSIKNGANQCAIGSTGNCIKRKIILEYYGTIEPGYDVSNKKGIVRCQICVLHRVFEKAKKLEEAIIDIQFDDRNVELIRIEKEL